MHPSNYSQLGRRRSCTRDERAEETNQNLRGNESIGSSAMVDENGFIRSHSGPSLREATENAFRPVGCLQNNGTSNLENSQEVMDSGYSTVAERLRRRSGSWAGATESDDDMAHISNIVSPPTIQIDFDQLQDESLTSSTCTGTLPEYTNTYQNGPEFTNTYQNGPEYTNTNQNGYVPNTENTVPEFDLHYEELMRRRLKFFFMNPIEKWHAKRRVPWKLFVQIIKIIIVTAQLCMFATQRYNHVTYLWDTKISFSHLFIKGWDPTREVTAYPPSNGPLALYIIDDFYDSLDYAITMYSNIENTAIGAYKYEYKNGSINMPTFCVSEYDRERIGRSKSADKTTNEVPQRCFDIPSSVINSTEKWSTLQFLKENNFTINFDMLLEASFSFSLQTIKLRPNVPFETPECYLLQSSILFDNTDHDGQMLVDLDIGAMVLECDEIIHLVHDDIGMDKTRTVLNVMTIGICLLSFIMCVRAIFRARSLKTEINKFFIFRFHRKLTFLENFEFLNLWYVLICFNDTLIFVGSIIKMGLESKDYDGYLDKWNVCSLLLGLGNLFVWFGCLRYLGFFETYNVLILTIKSCFPNVLRYSICIMMVFAGYSFCGWLVLGPYHLKFRSLSTAIECLYSLINGDDMFATFSSTVGKDAIVWWFSRIYLYTFISLFIYVILSLFIAIIMDSYETIKRYYEVGFPVSELRQFANECQADPGSGAFQDEESSIQDFINRIFCCRRASPSRSEYEPLVT